MPPGRTKSRITVAIEPVLARALDAQARSMGVTRSALVEEAISEWLRRRIEEDYGTLQGLEKKNGKALSTPGETSEEDGEATVAARMVLEALRYQFPAMQQISDEELRRRALVSQNQSRGRR